jgi:hypothetical protein
MMATMTVSYKIKTFDGHEYWSPMSRFLRGEKELLNLWRIHYHRLGIRTRTERNELFVHLKDDLAAWQRELPFDVRTYKTQARVYTPKGGD